MRASSSASSSSRLSAGRPCGGAGRAAPAGVAPAPGAPARRPAGRRRPGPAVPARRPGRGRPGRAARRTAAAAAATEALPMTRMVGSPSSQAAEATSARACGVGLACGDRWAASALRVAVGASRQRRPRLAASKKSWVVAPPAAGPQSVGGPRRGLGHRGGEGQCLRAGGPRQSAPAVAASDRHARRRPRSGWPCAGRGGSTAGATGSSGVPPGRRLEAAEPTGILAVCCDPGVAGHRRQRAPIRRRAPRRSRRTRTSPPGTGRGPRGRRRPPGTRRRRPCPSWRRAGRAGR